MSKRKAIGIDLGTTNSCVGVFRDRRVDILENDMGQRTTPSRVAFDGIDIHVGEAAKAQAAVNPKNTVFEAKRLIGRRFADDTVQEDIEQWPFEVFDDNGAPKIRVNYNKERKVFSPELIASMVLKRMKEFADRSTGDDIHDAVITVPAYFNDSQRQATIDAGKIAGLNVLCLINEPTAAALAYGYARKRIRDETVMVFDFGGGTFDVSIISIANNEFNVKAVGGDTHLGGADLDTRLVNHFLEIVKQKHNKDISSNQGRVLRLREACEKAKILLSTSSGFKATVSAFGILDGEDFQETLSRTQFEQLSLDLFKKTIEHVESVLTDAGMNKSDIDEVILVGGSSRIPKIQELLSEFFDGKKLNSTINPDEAVAYGAAVKAALASGEHTIEEITLADVVPLSLGLKNHQDDMMIVFIKRNSRIPISAVQDDWTAVLLFETSVNVDVYEGERISAADNNILGTFSFDMGNEEMFPKLSFTFEVDVNGILHVSGVNRNNQKSAGITITSNKGRHTKEEIEKMVQEVKQLKIT